MKKRYNLELSTKTGSREFIHVPNLNRNGVESAPGVNHQTKGKWRSPTKKATGRLLDLPKLGPFWANIVRSYL